MYLIVGLGNPGEEYEKTRHNIGRIILDYYAKKNKFEEWLIDGKLKAITSDGFVGKNKVKLIEPETFMNKSGLSIKSLITSKKKAETLVVVYDDLDLALGDFKISWNKGTGGHKGLESIVKTIKTKEFIRLRVGITPITPTGKLKKVKGENKVLDFLMKDFTKKDLEILKKAQPKITKALDSIIIEGRVKAMNEYN
ncbi:MAG: aminoacyl-tRNA hydrolase [Candidatus Pacebacteria bacterium]|nr:aminoacyl-tRNA hydrolase [Candidatus Paceibacterota bacterium]